MKRLIALIALTGAAVAWSVPALAANSQPPIPIEKSIRSEGKAVSLDVTGATAQQVVDALSKSLGTRVLLMDSIDKTVTLKFTDLAASKALDKVAAEFGCKWQRRYTLQKKKDAKSPAQEHQPSGKVVTIDVSNQDIQVVARMIAKAAGGKSIIGKDLEGTKTSLKADSMPVEQALDTICAPLSAEWRMEYILSKSDDVKVVEAPKEEKPKDKPITRVEAKVQYTNGDAEEGTPKNPNQPDQQRGPQSFPNTAPIWQFFGQGVTSPDQLSGRISEGINGLFGMSAADRQQRIQQFSEGLGSIAHHMDEADPASLNRFYERMGPGLRTGLDMIGNLPADRRREMQPITDVIERILKQQPKQ